MFLEPKEKERKFHQFRKIVDATERKIEAERHLEAIKLYLRLKTLSEELTKFNTVRGILFLENEVKEIEEKLKKANAHHSLRTKVDPSRIFPAAVLFVLIIIGALFIRYAGITGYVVVCIAEWDCSEWVECSPEGIQTRKCVHTGTCFILDNKPEEERECEYIAPVIKPEKICFDGIKNQNEEGVDCGGVCKPCEELVAPEEERLPIRTFLIGLLIILFVVILERIIERRQNKGVKNLGIKKRCLSER